MRTIDISLRTILKVVAVVLIIMLLARIVDVLILLFISLILSAALDPIADYLSRSMPRWLAVVLIFCCAILLFAAVIYILVPPLVTQSQDLVAAFRTGSIHFTLHFFGYDIDSQRIVTSLTPRLDEVTKHLGAIVSTTRGIIFGLTAFVTVMVLTLYTLLDERHLKQSVVDLVPAGYQAATIKIAAQVGEKMGFWVRGQIALSFIIGLAVYVGLTIFGINFALPLAVFAGFTELIPILGPFLGGGAAVLVALTQGLTQAILIGIWFLVVQQLEAHVLVPQVMRKALGLSPVVVIIALLIGGKLYGLLGIVLSVPVAAAISVMIKEWPAIAKAIEQGPKGPDSKSA